VAYLSASYRDAIVYGLLLLVLVVRPQGLLGTVQRQAQRV
jgi:branched-chain amino acid transport system permease protein